MNQTVSPRANLGSRGRVSLLRKLSLVRPLIRKALPAPAEAPVLMVDYPKRKESIVFPEYTFRIETTSAEPVEISIDGDDWKPCRRAVGYWWYDWANYGSGVHQAVVRLRPRGGETTPSRTCLFRVDLTGARA